jgi:hypothetical protein
VFPDKTAKRIASGMEITVDLYQVNWRKVQNLKGSRFRKDTNI